MKIAGNPNNMKEIQLVLIAIIVIITIENNI